MTAPIRQRLRVLVADDEPLAVEGLCLLVAADADLELVGVATNGPEALARLRSSKPDLVLLDVQMPGLSGFEVLERVDPGDMPLVIFVTAFDRYALKAFDVHALDYLLKPVDEERFREALGRFKAYAAVSQTAELSDRLVELVAGRRTRGVASAAAVAGPPLRRIAVRDVDRVRIVEVAEIDWIEAADYYVALHVGEQAILHRETMQRLEHRLDRRSFMRVHRSAIVNRDRIAELRRDGGRDLFVVLKDGARIKVAPSYRAQVDRWVEDL